MSGATDKHLRAHPELASLLGLSTLLDLLPRVLIAVHTDGPAGALQDQARSMIHVSRILTDQVNAYMGLLDVESKTRSKRPTDS